jgi:hypothetical protein
MNEFTVNDLFIFTQIFTGAKNNAPKEATQADIDKFYAS